MPTADVTPNTQDQTNTSKYFDLTSFLEESITKQSEPTPQVPQRTTRVARVKKHRGAQPPDSVSSEQHQTNELLVLLQGMLKKNRQALFNSISYASVELDDALLYRVERSRCGGNYKLTGYLPNETTGQDLLIQSTDCEETEVLVSNQTPDVFWVSSSTLFAYLSQNDHVRHPVTFSEDKSPSSDGEYYYSFWINWAESKYFNSLLEKSITNQLPAIRINLMRPHTTLWIQSSRTKASEDE